MSIFSNAEPVAEDAAFGIVRLAKADKHPKTVMLNAGVYRDEKGMPWTLPAVARAKEQLYSNASQNHDYLDLSGDHMFLSGARNILLGPKHSQDLRITSVQTVAGTGANHIGAVLLANVIKPKQVWFSSPTWVNHPLIWDKVDQRIQQRSYPYWKTDTNTFDLEGMLSCLNTESSPGDVLILQSCAHNPTGIDPTKEQWRAIADLCQSRKLFPFFDSAYQGFASGNLEDDGWAMQYFLDKDDIELGIAQSFSKNFGLYSERVGALHFKTSSRETATTIHSLLDQILRSEISTPPAFGARLVAKVLKDQDLFQCWMQDLQTMSTRIRTMRRALHAELARLQTPGCWKHILNQVGMFSYVGLTSEQVVMLRKDYHIYLLGTGRISMTGVTQENVGYIAACIDAVVRKNSEE